jgi:hypothetical protein
LDVRLVSEDGPLTTTEVVRAVNAHAALVEALKNARFSLRTFRNVPQADQAWTTIDDDVMAAIEAALALAEEPHADCNT